MICSIFAGPYFSTYKQEIPVLEELEGSPSFEKL